MNNEEKRIAIKEVLFNELKLNYEEREKRIMELIPEFEPMNHLEHNQPAHRYDVFDHTLAVVDNMPLDELGRLAALFHDIGKIIKRIKGNDGVYHYWGHPQVSSIMANAILNELGYDDETVKSITFMCLYHDSFLSNSYEEFIWIAKAVGFKNIKLLCNLQNADLLAHSEKHYLKHQKDLLLSHEKVNEFLERAISEGIYTP